jgi:hypothetical protein
VIRTWRVPSLEAEFIDANGPDVFDFSRVTDGGILARIDGVDALKSMIDFANQTVSVSKDIGSRFNLAVDGFGIVTKGYFAYRESRRYPIPGSPGIELEYLPGGGNATASVSNFGAAGGPKFNVTWFGSCTAPKPAAETAEAQLLGAPESTAATAAPTGPAMVDFAREWAATDASGAAPASELNATVGATYEIVNGTVGWLKLATFGPPSNADFIATIQDALAAFTTAGATKLVVDLRGNGGGDICLGYAAGQLLFPDFALPTGIYDIVATPLARDMAANGARTLHDSPGDMLRGGSKCSGDPELNGYYFPCVWREVNGTHAPFANDTWLTKGPTRAVPGAPVTPLSVHLREDCAAELAALVPSSLFKRPAPRDTVLLSDGLCGSTCAVFSSMAILRGAAKSVVVGGIATRKRHQFFSFPGGEVTSRWRVCSFFFFFFFCGSLFILNNFFFFSNSTQTSSF